MSAPVDASVSASVEALAEGAPAAVLEATGLVKRFGKVTAVNGIDITVRAGEVVGLLGPNGAGKTTTLRVLAGILPPTEGRVRVGGVDVAERPLEAKQRIGFLSGDTQLYQRLSPREVLRYFGRLYSMEADRLERRIEVLVRDLEMTEFAARPCGTLSTGQRQRANIARAFLHEPELLILDEPTNALDVLSGRFIVESIRRERAAGRAILLSTHVMSEAEYLCDRIVLVHEGRVIDQGTLAELLEHTGEKNLTDAFLHLVERCQVSAASAAPAVPQSKAAEGAGEGR
ncbi:ABC transporter ATP-binding protein [Chondromyces apiculatus]|uniref:Sodium ABC transporter ATP-binding protein n=1 Tax=Chondromyces apiculatus DSM 436 TaxID=1192034 RepID=A0A017SW89_9BACT|nr:ABC transporter ATP-binding protein [Chondromyces apiculatus]EYF01239.1 sodium ABC transporter ATP-binding protein [Chondromyces apiculatus DSM 436]